jgi:phage regulator Rha-like protein
MQPKYYEIQPQNCEPIARFNELEKAEAARAMYVAELAAMYERNAERFASTPAEKDRVIIRPELLSTSRYVFHHHLWPVPESTESIP